MANSLVEFERVAKRYKSFQALHDVSFHVNEGEIFGYIGPNGAGKTTTIKLLVGLLREFQGSIGVGTLQLPKDAHELHKLVGYLPQDPDYQPWRTVDHALMTFGLLSGVSKADLKQRIPELLDRFDLGSVRYKRIKKLSGGMKQKVGFVQAMLHRPKLLVLDEPLNALDPDARIRVRDLILEMKAEGTTVIFSSHILGDVQDVADRIGIIRSGRILKAGNIEELKEHVGLGRQVLVEFAAQPLSLDFMDGVPGVTHFHQDKPLAVQADKVPSTFRLHLEKTADVDVVVHQVITESLAGAGRIRRIHEYVPTLDEIYKTYIETPVEVGKS